MVCQWPVPFSFGTFLHLSFLALIDRDSLFWGRQTERKLFQIAESLNKDFCSVTALSDLCVYRFGNAVSFTITVFLFH